MYLVAGNAQIFVGGGIELNLSNGKSSLGSADYTGSGFGYNISPQIGYYLNEDWTIGVICKLGSNWSNGKRTDPADPTYDRNYKYFNNSWGFNFFGRHKLLGLGIENLSLIIEGNVGVQGSINKQTENDITTNYHGRTVYSINVLPVLSYKLSDKIDVLAFCNFLSIGYSFQTLKQPDNNYKSKNHNINLGFDSFSSYSNLNIGFIYKF